MFYTKEVNVCHFKNDTPIDDLKYVSIAQFFAQFFLIPTFSKYVSSFFDQLDWPLF